MVLTYIHSVAWYLLIYIVLHGTYIHSVAWYLLEMR